MRSILLLAVPALLLSSCALSRGAAPEAPAAEPEGTVIAAGDVDVLPRRLACSDYAEPARVHQMVFLEYVVDADGRVQPKSIRPTSPKRQGNGWHTLGGTARRPPADGGAVTTARRIAENCVYEPARAGDEPVSVRIIERFTF